MKTQHICAQDNRQREITGASMQNQSNTKTNILKKYFLKKSTERHFVSNVDCKWYFATGSLYDREEIIVSDEMRVVTSSFKGCMIGVAALHSSPLGQLQSMLVLRNQSTLK